MTYGKTPSTAIKAAFFDKALVIFELQQYF
jgi:hypothetical protein